MIRLPRPILAAASVLGVTLLTAGPLVVHLRDAMVGGAFTPMYQRAFWLPWQVYANVVSGRGLDDASGFPNAGDVGLFGLVGNPGAALLLAPLHAAGSPVLAHNVGILLMLLANAVSGWVLGAALRPRPRPALGAVLVGAAGVWSWQLGAGALAGWVAPGLAALAAWVATAERSTSGQRARGAWLALGLCWGLGVIVAPVVTGLVLLGGVLLLDHPRTARTDVAVILALTAGLVGGAMPAALGGAVSLPPTALAWVGSQGALGMPLAFGAGVWLAWRAGGAARLAAVAAIGCFVVAIGPFARDAAGELVSVGGFVVPITPDLGAVRHGHALLSGGLAIGLIAALAALSRTDLWLPGRVALGIGALVEPRLQAALGQPVALWTGDVWDVPAELSALGAQPYTTPILELPLLSVVDGMVGLVPFHRQAISSGPGATRGGAIDAGIERQVVTRPNLASLSRLGEGTDAEVSPIADEGGYVWILVAGGEASLRVAVQRAVGKPVVETDRFALWEVHPAGMGGPDVAPGVRPEDSGHPPGWAPPGGPGGGPGGAPPPGGGPGGGPPPGGPGGGPPPGGPGGRGPGGPGGPGGVLPSAPAGVGAAPPADAGSP